MQLSFDMPTVGNIKGEGSDIDGESPMAGLEPVGINRAETRSPPLCQLSSRRVLIRPAAAAAPPARDKQHA